MSGTFSTPRRHFPDSTSTEQRTVPYPGGLTGEAVAKVQPGRVGALTPSRAGIGNPPRHGQRNACNLESESVEKGVHFRAEAPPAGDDQRLGHRRGGDHDPIVGRESFRAGCRLGFVQQDRHQRGGVDRDPFGRPSPSYRKSWLRAALAPAVRLPAAATRIRAISARRASASGRRRTGTSSTVGWP